MLVRATVISLMAAWLLLTVVRQISNRPALWRWDVFCLIPRWTFFAPKPIQFDYLLLTRARGAEEPPPPWQESPFRRRRTLGELVFHPNSRCNRVLYVLTLQALQEARWPGAGSDERRFRDALARVVRSLPEPSTEAPREGLVVQSFGFFTERPPRAVMAVGAASSEL